MKIIDSIWFTGMRVLGVVGIVLGEDEVTGKRKAYIGNAPGLNVDVDTHYIAEYGVPLTPEIAQSISNFLNVEDQ